MTRKVASAGLIPLVVLALLALAFVAPKGSFAPVKVASSCPYGYASCTCKTATLTPPAATTPAGSPSTWTASSTGCPNPVYEFWVRYPNGVWLLRQAYSSNNVFVFNTHNGKPGTYVIVVHAKQQGHTARYEAYDSSTLVLTGCKNATLSQSSHSSARGVPVTFTASSSGCPNPIYRFFLRDPHGRWTLGQSGASNSFVWNTAGKAKGWWRIVVWVNQNNSYMGSPQTYAYKNHLIT